MPVCGNYLFFELPKKIVLNPKDGKYNDGEMSDTIPTDEDLAKGFAGIPDIPQNRE